VRIEGATDKLHRIVNGVFKFVEANDAGEGLYYRSIGKIWLRCQPTRMSFGPTSSEKGKNVMDSKFDHFRLLDFRKEFFRWKRSRFWLEDVFRAKVGRCQISFNFVRLKSFADIFIS
jgi:hypothetical protein